MGLRLHNSSDSVCGSMGRQYCVRYVVVPLFAAYASSFDAARTKKETSAMCTPTS